MTASVLIDTDDGVLTITWNEPDRLNALTADMLNDAAAAIEDAAESVRLVVITGTGRAFSSGAALGPQFDGSATLGGANRLIRAMTRSPLPIISAVNGIAAGVGCSIAIAADITLAKSSGYFLLAFVNIGLMPDGGSTELVAASVGRARANRMAMLGERLSADDAAQIGLIHKAVDDDAFAAELAMLVTKIGHGPTKALAAMKKVITANTLPRLDAALDAELAGQMALFDSSDFVEGGMSFLQKRPPEFTGR
ncbi:enoyl-CoA hydratase-related protein [Aeromicrobium sp.]|uniref:enoyl-CoA hydratase-related protein n=1 Tax=Aeromicrobium sp. TaxID=1871063 RepID=UPI0019988970|nr:enoyl-CoA hydratase-related protein [Aeromicrobium sp.]MBC7630112.1 enoyl-CoA hydratase/isomerase family protein [Aeromicrobium sp.]